MDKLEIDRIEYDIRHKLRWIEVWIKVKLNETVLPGHLVVRELLNAAQASGRYELFTCGCGWFECGGYYVDVTCTEGAFVLKNRYHPRTEDLLESFEYQISWQQVETFIRELRTRLHDISLLEPDLTLPMHEGVLGNPVDTMPSEQEYQAALAATRARISQNNP